MKVNVEYLDGIIETIEDKDETINGIMFNMNNMNDDNNFIRLGDGMYRKSNILSIVKANEAK